MKLIAFLTVATMALVASSMLDAGTYTFMSHLSNEEFRQQYLGLRTDFMKDTMLSMFLTPTVKNDPLPDHFDWREQAPGCIHAVRNQGHCGSCWAHSASEVVSDRFCIASKGNIDVVLSPQQLVDCDLLDHGCNGGFLTTPFLFYSIVGANDEGCYGAYTSGNTGKRDRACFLHKWGCKRYTTQLTSIRWLTSPQAIKEDLYKNGPVNTGFLVYEDFRNYVSGVYEHKTGGLLGGHAVKIVGWGKEDNVDFWIVQNSWSETWGENGFFRIKFGQGNIDASGVSVRPSL